MLRIIRSFLCGGSFDGRNRFLIEIDEKEWSVFGDADDLIYWKDAEEDTRNFPKRFLSIYFKFTE
jgi:hypothetical protein